MLCLQLWSRKVDLSYVFRCFRYEVILKLVPTSHHKILINIKKTLEREKRKKEREQDDDSDEEAEHLSKAKPETWVLNISVDLGVL